MNKQALENLVKIKKLHHETADREEINGLIRSGAIRLKDAQLESLSLESRFDLIYNATHALSLAALRHFGYRSDNRYLVFQCLQHTVDLPAQQWRILDTAHRKRNLAEYEGTIDLDESLIASLARVSSEVKKRIVTLTE